MSCKPGERSYLGGARCYPQSGKCFGNKEEDAGLCYPKCRNHFDGVGPVCWGVCDNSMVNCGLSCAKTTTDCALAVADQVISPFIVAANVASLGLATPATAGASATIRVGGKTVTASSKVGKSFISVVATLSKFQTIKPGGLKQGATVVQRIYQAKTGTIIKQIGTTAKITSVGYKAMQQFRQSFAEDFAAQTSTDIAKELDSHFNPTTAKYIKGLWGERMIAEMAEANNWQIASTALAAASIVDITGVTGVVSAYAKPECGKIVPFPCTDSNKNNCNGKNNSLHGAAWTPTNKLGLCEGDCDKDSDCAGSLQCFQRNGFTPVPGCVGQGVSNMDYCVETTPLSGTAWTPTNKLGLCQGDCDRDSDCASGLKCFQRNGFTPVPGCAGQGVSGMDYCVKP